MTNSRWTLRAALVVAAFFFGTTALRAQGATTGGITGTVTVSGGQPVEQVQIQVSNTATGFRAAVQTNASGRYTVPGLQPGNTYTVVARRIGYAPQTRTGVVVTLSQATRIDFELEQQAANLAAVHVVGETSPVITPSHMGAATQVTDSAIARLPSLNRNFTDLVALTPQISTTLSNGGLSGGGTNNHYNNVQIDGSTEMDIFGLGATGQPGGQANGKSIGLESVKEYQVMLSPYDVRLGNFSGALINAVTKSGTNDFHGSVVANTRNQQFSRSEPYITAYQQSQYGVSVGGPILKDKAFFFINPEFQARTTPASGPYMSNGVCAGGTNCTLTQAHVDSFTTALTGYGYGPGDIGSAAAVNNNNPLKNFFGRLDFNLPYNTQLVLHDNWGSAQNDIFSRSNTGFSLSQNGYKFLSDKQAPAMQIRTLLPSGAYNEFLAGFTKIRDRRRPNSFLPMVTVNAAGTGLVAGAERSSQGNELDQDIAEITENFTIPVQTHRITLGTSDQWMRFRNQFTQNSYGSWTFGNTSTGNGIDSLLDNNVADCAPLAPPCGRANNLLVGVPATGTDGIVRFRSNIYSAYLEDQWSVTPRLSMQYGIRADDAVFPCDKSANAAMFSAEASGETAVYPQPGCYRPPRNPAMDTTAFHINTSNVPSGNVIWSPRIGFNWDATGDQRNQIRGGIGSFSGRPAYVWVSNAFQNSGLSGVNQLTCSGFAAGANGTATAAPLFTPATIAAPPTACDSITKAGVRVIGKGVSAAAGGEIDLLDPSLKYPTNIRATLGWDHTIGENWVFTLEGMYSKGINSLFYENIALKSVYYGYTMGGTASYDSLVNSKTCPAAGACGPSKYEAGRWIYGTAGGGTSAGTPDVLVNGRTGVYLVTNNSGDYSYNLTAQMQHRFADNFEGSFAYTFSRAYDAYSYGSSTAQSQYRFSRPTSYDQTDKSVSRSEFEEPNRLVGYFTYTLPTHTDVSVEYFGESGTPFWYTVNGDANGDGQTSNDAMYIPKNALDTTEIKFATATFGGVTYSPTQQAQALQQYISDLKCMNNERGQLMTKSACSSPFTNQFNVSIRQSLKTIGYQNVVLELAIINFSNLINKNWGIQPGSSAGSVTLVNMATQTTKGSNMVTTQNYYTFNPTFKTFLQNNLASNYQMQLQMHYTF